MGSSHLVEDDESPTSVGLSRQCSTLTNSTGFRAHDLLKPALPVKPGHAARSDRPGLPARPIIINQSRWSDEVEKVDTNPDDFYLPFSAYDKEEKSKKFDNPFPLFDPKIIVAREKALSPSVCIEETGGFQKTIGNDDPSSSLSAADDMTLSVVTPRSILVGIVLSVIAAAIAQLFQFKPVRVQISLLTLQILSFLLGTLLTKTIPARIRWLNPGPFTIKEDVFATLMAAAAAYGAFGTEVFAPQILFLSTTPGYFLSAAAQFTNQLLAICLVWLFRPFLVYPAQCAIIPPVILFQSLHGGDSLAGRRIAYFKKFAPLIGLWELLPQFFSPALGAINFFCMCLPAAPAVTEIFGGSSPNTQKLQAEIFHMIFFFSLVKVSFDWANISAGVNGASPMYVPWIAQVNSWIALAIAIFMYLSLYKLRVLNSGLPDGYPLLSTELLNISGGEYNRSAVFLSNGSLNWEGVRTVGLPAFTISFVVSQAFAALLMTSAITQAVFQNWGLIKSLIMPRRNCTEYTPNDPHLQAMKNYSDIPAWFLGGLGIASIALGYLCATIAGSRLGVTAMLGSIFLGAMIIGSIGFLNATAGFNPIVAPACQMVGAIFGGSVIRSLWYIFCNDYPLVFFYKSRFSLFSATCATISLLLIKELSFLYIKYSLICIKLMIYTKIPPWKGFLAQVMGTLVGVTINQAVMQTIVSKNAEALVQPTASGQFSGISSQALFNEVSTWSLFAGELYGPGKRYFFVPLFLAVGVFLPIPFLVIQKFYPKSLLGKVNAPLMAGTIQVAISGSTAGRITAIVVGFFSQFYMRLFHSQWYSDYNHVLSAALDGGTQLVILFLSFAVGGGAGYTVKLPHYFLNPAAPFLRDYCTRF
ncbi:putative oligopeptide transporter [Phakopsora pachyrhizi]|uniref:Oligopeptide transporter n=1 Tax=Phakopsora pachyrhizi TaxID=170000 RepID=A0AAV0BLE6_PHAPC|nr:putative oligopeptide transporter [Phakopsora pachyrhizi]